MINAFDDENGLFNVLINDEGQNSLWPAFFDVPAGWTAVDRPASRKVCLAYVNRTWIDMRPKSLVRQMNNVKCGSVLPRSLDNDTSNRQEENGGKSVALAFSGNPNMKGSL